MYGLTTLTQIEEKEFRSCLECGLLYLGDINCPNCKEPIGEPIPEDWIVYVLKTAPFLFSVSEPKEEIAS